MFDALMHIFYAAITFVYVIICLVCYVSDLYWVRGYVYIVCIYLFYEGPQGSLAIVAKRATVWINK